MRHFIKNTTKASLTLRQQVLLNGIKPGLASIAQKRLFSSDDNLHKHSEERFVRYTTISEDASVFERIKSATDGAHVKDGKKFTKASLQQQKVMIGKPGDVELRENDAYSKILVVSKSKATLPLTIRYGGRGVAPSPTKTPEQLLERSFTLPKGEVGIVGIRNHVPFSFDSASEDEAEILPLDDLRVVKEYDREEIEQRSSMTKVLELPNYIARTINAEMVKKVCSDTKHEDFYEETTLPLIKPDATNQSSETAMIFDYEEGIGKHATKSHYHPGDRVLYVFTTNVPSGVTLNHCGINEDPNKCPHTAVHYDFPPNSLIILRFEESNHPRFKGKFTCISGHPKDGKNIIENIGKGNAGFLASATVFSQENGNVDIWDADLPTTIHTEQKELALTR